MTSKPWPRPRLVPRIVGSAFVAACTLGLALDAHADLTLNQTGIDDGFSLSTFYTDPNAYYGLVDAVGTASGQVFGSGYARGQLYKFNDVDGQSFGSAVAGVSAGGTPTGIAVAGGVVYVGILGGHYYSVDPVTLALTQVITSTTVNAYYGLWGNQTNGHLIAGTSQGLLDINPLTGATTQVGNPGGNIDGVTVSPDGKTAYVETNSNSIYGYSLTAPDPTHPIFTDLNLAHGPDGTGIISGGKFDGDIVVNNNDGTVGLIDHVTGVETLIATGGARGDLVGPDLSNGTLFLSSSNQMYRLSCGPDCAIGSTVPEPATAGMFGLGLSGLLLLRRRGVV